MKKRTLSVIGLSLLLVGSLSVVPVAKADDAPAASQIAEDQTKLAATENEIQSIDDKVAQLQKSIEDTQKKKADVAGQAQRLKQQAEALMPSLEAKTKDFEKKRATLLAAISIDYQSGEHNPIEVLAEKGSVSEFLSKESYVASVEKRFGSLATEAKSAYDTLRNQKQDLDNKRSSLETLQRQMDSLDAGIAIAQQQLQEAKNNKGNEANYLAQKIEQEKAAQADLLNATKGGNALWGTYSDGAHVNKGDVVGYEGSTGNSTGCHTHFSVIQDGQWVDPMPFISAGMFRRPDGSITQYFGMTEWASSGAYGGRIHNGVDFVQPCGAEVHAAESGTVIRDNRTDGSGFGHYIMIRHQNGLITLYGHLI